MANLSRSSSRRSSGNGQVDAIGNNHPILTEDLIKAAAQVFDPALVFKLTLHARGINTIRPTAMYGCINVTEIDLSFNKIDRIQGLERCTALRKLTLIGNRLKRVEGLEHLESLEVLQLQENRIERVDDLYLGTLAALPSLRALYLQNIDGTLANPVARQGGYRDAVLSRLPNLRTLDGERKPHMMGYAKAASSAVQAAAFADMDVTIEDIDIPRPAPWLEGWSWEEGAETGALLKGINANVKALRSKVDQCRMLMNAVNDELKKARKQAAVAE